MRSTKRRKINPETSSPSLTEQQSTSGPAFNRSDDILRDSPVLKSIVILDDHDSWEQGMSADADLKQVQESQNHSGMLYYRHPHHPASPQFVLDLQNILKLDAGVENDSTEVNQAFYSNYPSRCETNTIDSQHLDDEYTMSHSLGEYPLRSRRRERSQTAPQLINESSHQTIYPQPLRRNQTSPLHDKASSAQFDALQHAYAVITDTGTSQVGVQDIMQAKRLVQQISQVLDEQMCAKFGAQGDLQGGVG